MDFLECCTCAVCLELFADPRMLSCGHTYCQKCIEPLLEQGYPRKITCPECRTESRQPTNGFPVNYGLGGMASMIHASSGVRGVGTCGRCQKKSLLSELFSCSSCEEWSVETSRLCGLCIAKWHKGHDYKELELASKDDIHEALEKIATAHEVCSNVKDAFINMKRTIADVVLRLEKRLDERMSSMDALAMEIIDASAWTKNQLSDKVQTELCGRECPVWQLALPWWTGRVARQGGGGLTPTLAFMSNNPSFLELRQQMLALAGTVTSRMQQIVQVNRRIMAAILDNM